MVYGQVVDHRLSYNWDRLILTNLGRGLSITAQFLLPDLRNIFEILL